MAGWVERPDAPVAGGGAGSHGSCCWCHVLTHPLVTRKSSCTHSAAAHLDGKDEGQGHQRLLPTAQLLHGHGLVAAKRHLRRLAARGLKLGVQQMGVQPAELEQRC